MGLISHSWLSAQPPSPWLRLWSSTGVHAMQPALFHQGVQLPWSSLYTNTWAGSWWCWCTVKVVFSLNGWGCDRARLCSSVLLSSHFIHIGIVNGICQAHRVRIQKEVGACSVNMWLHRKRWFTLLVWCPCPICCSKLGLYKSSKPVGT